MLTYNLSAESGEILFSQTVNSHQMNVRVLFPLELFATHVTRPGHMKLHVGVKLILLGKGLLTALLGTLEVGAVLPRQMSPEGGEGEHDRDVTHVTGILGRLLLLLLHTGPDCGFHLLG